jgi:hypothetical protein
MKYIAIFAIVLFSASPSVAQQTREINERRNFVQLEYAPRSHHLSDDDAPAGGYNEKNNVILIKLGREYNWKPNWKYALSIGYTEFDNSYNRNSNGYGVGAEAIYLMGYNTSFYGGGDFGFVSGYQDNVNNDFVIFDKYIPFLALNAGFEYMFNDKLPSIRLGGKYVPGSVIDSDDVIAFTFGTKLKF